MELSSNFPEFEALIKVMPCNVYLLDKNNIYRGCNIQQARAFGMNCIEDVIGKRNIDFPVYAKHQYLAEILDLNNLKVMRAANPEPTEFDEEGCYVNSEICVFKSYKVPIFDVDKKVIGLLGASFDISNSKREFEELKHKFNKLEAALDNILANLPGHVYWVDINNCFLGCNNQQAYDFNLKTRHEIVGLSVNFLQTPEDAEAIINNNNKVIKNGEIIAKEENFKNMNGEQLTYLSKKVPLKNKKGEITGLLGISIDITKEKEAIIKATAEKSKAEAEENLRNVITTYADATVHNLQTPITTISLMLDVQEELNNKFLKLYQAANKNGVKVSDIISPDDLKLLKGESDLLVKQKGCISRMGEIIEDNLKNLKNAIKIHNGQEIAELIRCNISKNLDLSRLQNVISDKDKDLIDIKLHDNFSYMGNHIAMDQVVINLLSNALYQIKKNGKGEIFITSEDVGAMNILRIKDTAGGATPEVVNRMFDSHYTTKSDGNGVGLDFCKKVMQSFNGSITANSKEGEYMEVILFLPKVNER